MSEFPKALEITLKKRKPLAPPFHKHIARGKMLGKPFQVGDKIVVYEVIRTVPEGRVAVTEETVIHYE